MKCTDKYYAEKCTHSLNGECGYTEYCSYQDLQGTQDKSKSLSPYRHTLEDGADATTELVSGKSSGFIGGMRQEKTNLSDERIDTKQTQGHKRIS